MRVPLWVVPVAKLVTTAIAIGGIYIVQLAITPVGLPEPLPVGRTGLACAASDPVGRYFGPGIFGRREPMVRPRASATLEAAAERPLSCGPAMASETLRLLWLRPADSPLIVRIDRSQTGAVAVATVLRHTPADSSSGDSRPLARLDHQLTDQAFVELDAALEQAGVWNGMPDGVQSNDGDEWIVERRHGSSYKAVHRFSPGPGPFRDACMLFLKAVDLGGTEPRGQ